MNNPSCFVEKQTNNNNNKKQEEENFAILSRIETHKTLDLSSKS